MTPNEQWLKPFEAGELVPSLSLENKRKLAELHVSFHHLTEALMAQLPACQAKTQALLQLQQSALWTRLAVEVFSD